MPSKDEIEMPTTWYSFTKTWHNTPYPAISPSREELSATGRNVVVTGGGTGIGRAIAIAFAEAGAASVSILGRREDRLQKAKQAIIAARSSQKTAVNYEVADLNKRSEVDKALQSIADQFGQIGVFVSNAAVLPEPGLVATGDADNFMFGLEMNVRSAFNAIQAFVPRAAPQAVLLSISSGAAHVAPVPGMGAYATSKAANLKMMDYFAAENPSLHVVNVQPGLVETEMTEGSAMKVPDERTLEHIYLRVTRGTS